MLKELYEEVKEIQDEEKRLLMYTVLNYLESGEEDVFDLLKEVKYVSELGLTILFDEDKKDLYINKRGKVIKNAFIKKIMDIIDVDRTEWFSVRGFLYDDIINSTNKMIKDKVIFLDRMGCYEQPVKSLYFNKAKQYYDIVDSFIETNTTKAAFCELNEMKEEEFDKVVELCVRANPKYEEIIDKKLQENSKRYIESNKLVAEKLSSGELTFKEFANDKVMYPVSYQEIKRLMSNFNREDLVLGMKSKFSEEIVSGNIDTVEVIKVFTSKRRFIANTKDDFSRLAISELQGFITEIENKKIEVNSSRGEVYAKLQMQLELTRKNKKSKILRSVKTDVKFYEKPFKNVSYINFNETTTLSDGTSYTLVESDILSASEELIKEKSLVCDLTVRERAVSNVLGTKNNKCKIKE